MNSLNSLEDIILSHDDPYQYFLSILNSKAVLHQYNKQPIGRDMLKDLLYTTIYSSESRQESNVNRKLKFIKRRYRFADFVSLFPEFFTSLTEPRFTTGLPLHLVINREESKYAQEVLKMACLEQRLPVLPLHDSFITTSSHTDSLKKNYGCCCYKLI